MSQISHDINISPDFFDDKIEDMYIGKNNNLNNNLNNDLNNNLNNDENVNMYLYTRESDV